MSTRTNRYAVALSGFVLPRLLAASGILAACGTSAVQQTATTTIELGAIIPKTGSNASPNYEVAVAGAVEDMNAALATQSAKFRFKVPIDDSTNTPKVASTLAQQLAANGAKGLVLDGSGTTVQAASLDYGSDAGAAIDLPIVCAICTSPLINDSAATDPDPVRQATLRDASNWIFRTTQSNAPQATVLVAIAKSQGDLNHDGTWTVGILAPDDVFGKGFSNAATTAVGTDGVVVQVTYAAAADPNTLDYAGLAAKLATPASGPVPDQILDASFPSQGIGFFKAYSAASITIPLIHSDTFRRGQVLSTLGDLINGQYGVSAVSHDTTPSGAYFLQKMNVQGFPLDVFDAAMFDATTTLMLAAAKAAISTGAPASVSPAQIRDALPLLSDPSGEVVELGPAGLAKAIAAMQAGKAIRYQGAQGNCAFNSVGDVRVKQTRWVVQNKQYVEKEVYDCQASDTCPLVQ